MALPESNSHSWQATTGAPFLPGVIICLGMDLPYGVYII